MKSGEVYGPGALDAYELEAKIAEYPRIVVSAELREYVSAVAQPKTEPGSKATRLANALAK
jgi:hypothetical protein